MKRCCERHRAVGFCPRMSRSDFSPWFRSLASSGIEIHPAPPHNSVERRLRAWPPRPAISSLYTPPSSCCWRHRARDVEETRFCSFGVVIPPLTGRSDLPGRSPALVHGGLVANLLLALIAGHVIAALWHQFAEGPDTAAYALGLCLRVEPVSAQNPNIPTAHTSFASFSNSST